MDDSNLDCGLSEHHQSGRRRSQSQIRKRRSRRRSPTDREASRERNIAPRSSCLSSTTYRGRVWYAETYDPIQVGSIDGTDTVPHDKALVRAMYTPFDPSKDPHIQGNPYATLFVGRLHYDTTEETLWQFFDQYGRIERIRLVRDTVTNQSKGYAFVEFREERDFRQAYYHSNRKIIDGRTILIDYERCRVMKGWKPRRLGGGLGGEKESGQLRFGGRERPFKPPSRELQQIQATFTQPTI